MNITTTPDTVFLFLVEHPFIIMTILAILLLQLNHKSKSPDSTGGCLPYFIIMIILIGIYTLFTTTF